MLMGHGLGMVAAVRTAYIGMHALAFTIYRAAHSL